MDREEDEKEFSGFVGRALRGPKRGIHENLLASLLIRGSSLSDPLRKISCLCQAGFLCDGKEVDLPQDLLETASVVCMSFRDTILPQKPEGPIRIAWAFPKSEENWKQFIVPWQKLALSYVPLRTSYRKQNYDFRMFELNPVYDEDKAANILGYMDKVASEVHEAIKEMPGWKAFFQKTSALTPNCFHSLRSEFSQWALINLSPVQREIAKTVDPQVWREAISFMMQETGQEESAKLEGPMDSRE